jgi:hypothetical protein
MSDSSNLVLNGAGQQTAPASGTTIATVALPTESQDVLPQNDSSKWLVEVDCVQAGTVDTANLTSVGLYCGSTLLGNCLASATGSKTIFRAVWPGPQRASNGTVSLFAKATGTFGGGAIVTAVITATRMS